MDRILAANWYATSAPCGEPTPTDRYLNLALWVRQSGLERCLGPIQHGGLGELDGEGINLRRRPRLRVVTTYLPVRWNCAQPGWWAAAPASNTPISTARVSIVVSDPGVAIQNLLNRESSVVECPGRHGRAWAG